MLASSNPEVIQAARFAQYGKIILKPLKNYDSIKLQYLRLFPETITLKYSWTLITSAYSTEDDSTLFFSIRTSKIGPEDLAVKIFML